MIGNGAYANLDAAAEPRQRRHRHRRLARSLGFEVMSGTEPRPRRGMIALIGDFLEAARTADVSLFYYAGHGFQIDGRNYLVPVDASLRAGTDIARWTIRSTRSPASSKAAPASISSSSTPAATTRFPRRPPSLAGTDRDGLARVGDAAGFLFAFATQPDNVAYDGVGRNSFFAQALLGHLNTPGQDIASMMIAVRRTSSPRPAAARCPGRIPR